MASLGVLASLMQNLTPQMPGYDPLEVQRQRTSNQTGLMTLADLKAKQAAEAAMFEQIKNDPEVARRIFGDGAGPLLGSLQQPQGQAGGAPGGAPPAPGPITQSPLGGGPGQQIPAAPHLSQFATQGAPQSTIASLGPAGQPPMQAPRNPALELARTDPRAAMMLQQQMQGQQDRQWKLQEQQLSNGVKVAEYVSRMLHGVTNQETLDQAREQIRLVHPQAASQVPQMYSKEGVEAVQQRGATITEMAQNRLNEAKARNLDMETQMFPELAKRFGLGDDVWGLPARAPQRRRQRQRRANRPARLPRSMRAPSQKPIASIPRSRLSGSSRLSPLSRISTPKPSLRLAPRGRCNSWMAPQKRWAWMIPSTCSRTCAGAPATMPRCSRSTTVMSAKPWRPIIGAQATLIRLAAM